MFLQKRNKGIIYNIKLLLLSTAVIMIWRGIWNLLDHYLLPEYFDISNMISILLGVGILFILDLNLEALGVGDEE